jgi:ubiquinone/menaquinone biosynthesis C-methylase UbiE
MDNQLNEWNNIFLSCGAKKPQYDDWLDKYHDFLDKSKDIPIIDLGCGFGNDTLYLTERGYQVISCDYSIEALNRLKFFIEKPNIRQFNMVDGLPFDDNTVSVLIADLSIHYFSWENTKKIINEISRVLMYEGYFICRVNSTKDSNHGAGQGDEIEENFINFNGKLKRFFDRKQLLLLFDGWKIINICEYELNRTKKPKIVWEIAIKKYEKI